MKLNNIHKTSIKDNPIVVGTCPECNHDLVKHRGRFGEFVSCSNYPNCKYIEKSTNKDNLIAEKCPDCGKPLEIKRTKDNHSFYGCSDYPKCKYSRWPEENDTLINSKTINNVSDTNISVDNSNDYEYKAQFKNDFREDLQMEVRSSWEANVARILKYLNIEFDYETDGYQLNTNDSNYKYASQLYIPDFILKDKTIIEVKGHMDYRSLQNTKLFLERYPNERLIIIDSDIYYLLSEKYSSIVPNWECEKNNIISNIISVVGITFKERAIHVSKLIIGEELYLERDYNNTYDKNAIKVLDENSNHLGYISGDYACFYAPKMDYGIKYTVVLKEIEDKVLKVSIKANNLDDIEVSSIINIF